MLTEHQSKNKKPLLVIYLAVIIVGVALLIWQNQRQTEPLVVINNPEPEEITSNFTNPQLEKAVTAYLLTEKHFSWKNEKDSFNFCTIENLEPNNELFPLSIWAYCAEYKLEGTELKTVSGSSLPAKIDYPNELSFYDLNKFSYEAPRDGSYYPEDIQKIFSEEAQQNISNIDKSALSERNETKALNNILTWGIITQAIRDCEVEQIFQAHSQEVAVKLKDGTELKALEPNLDDVMKIANDAKPECGSVIMIIE